MLKKIMMVILLVIPLCMADTVTTCLNSNTMQRNTTKQLIIDSNVTDIFVNENVTCQYGCSNSQCQEASILNITMFSVIFGGGLIMMLISAWSGNDTFGLIGGLMLMLLGTYLAAQGIVVNSILQKNILVRMIGLALISVGLYTMYSFGRMQIEEKKGGEADGG